MGFIPVAVTKISDIVPVWSRELLDIQSTRECRLTLKRVCDMMKFLNCFFINSPVIFTWVCREIFQPQHMLSISFLLLRVTQKKLCNCLRSFYSCPSRQCFRRTDKFFLRTFHRVFPRTCVTSTGHNGKCLYPKWSVNLKCCVWEHNMPCALGINSNGRFKWGYGNLALQPLKPLYLDYHNTYGYQAWQGGDLSWWVLAWKVSCFFSHVILRDHKAN